MLLVKKATATVWSSPGCDLELPAREPPAHGCLRNNKDPGGCGGQDNIFLQGSKTHSVPGSGRSWGSDLLFPHLQERFSMDSALCLAQHIPDIPSWR